MAIGRILRNLGWSVLKTIYPSLKIDCEIPLAWDVLKSTRNDCTFEETAIAYIPYHLSRVNIGKYTYIAGNSSISLTDIGRFCSIGPNFFCGWGLHPTNGLSTAPMFYSASMQNGYSICKTSKVTERKKIVIGNDVFIGANVTVIDGISIGHGAVIGAGAVVSKDIPPYAIAVGCPIQIIGYRFTDEEVRQLLEIKWWNFDDTMLGDIEKYFFDIFGFLQKHSKRQS